MRGIVVMLVVFSLAGCLDPDPEPALDVGEPAWAAVMPSDEPPVNPALSNQTAYAWNATPGDVAVRWRIDGHDNNTCSVQAEGHGVAEPGVNLVLLIESGPTMGVTASGLAPYVAVTDVDSDDVLEDDTWGGAVGTGFAGHRADITVLARNVTELAVRIECRQDFDVLDGHFSAELGLWSARSMRAVASAGLPVGDVVLLGLETISLESTYARFIVDGMQAQVGQATVEGPAGIDTWTMPELGRRDYQGAGDYTFSMLASGSTIPMWWAAGYGLQDSLF